MIAQREDVLAPGARGASSVCRGPADGVGEVCGTNCRLNMHSAVAVVTYGPARL